MSYPEFQDMVRYHSDPERYLNPLMDEDELMVKKSHFMDGLERLRSKD